MTVYTNIDARATTRVISKRLHPPKHPLQMPIRHPRLELGLHMPTQKRLRPHQPPLQMLDAHRALRPIDPRILIRRKHRLVLQVWLGDDNGRGGLGLEAQFAVPGHVLDGEEGAVCDDDHVEVAVRDEDAVRGLDDLREDVLDGVGGEVAFALGAGVAAREDGVDGAFGPVDVRGRVDGGFDVCAVEVCGGAFGGVDELGGEGEDVPEEGALLVYFVDIEAGVVGQGGVVDQVQDIAVAFSGEIEVFRWLVSWRREREVFFSEIGVSAGFIETVDLSEERLIELEEGLVLHNEGHRCNFFLRVDKLANARVIYQGSCRGECHVSRFGASNLPRVTYPKGHSTLYPSRPTLLLKRMERSGPHSSRL